MQYEDMEAARMQERTKERLEAARMQERTKERLKYDTAGKQL
jgi:hypothetical protein